MRRSNIVPDSVLVEVITALYDDADAAGWEALTSWDRSHMYDNWMLDERIGGVLTRYMTSAAARSWTRKNPMQEYAHASRGVGRYAAFRRDGGTQPSDIVKFSLGNDAQIVQGTSAVSPFRCQAVSRVDGQGSVATVVWGGSRQFKDLIWTALRAAAQGITAVHIVVMELPGMPVSPDDRGRQLAIAKRCSIELHYLREVLGNRRGQE